MRFSVLNKWMLFGGYKGCKLNLDTGWKNEMWKVWSEVKVA